MRRGAAFGTIHSREDTRHKTADPFSPITVARKRQHTYTSILPVPLSTPSATAWSVGIFFSLLHYYITTGLKGRAVLGWALAWRWWAQASPGRTMEDDILLVWIFEIFVINPANEASILLHMKANFISPCVLLTFTSPHSHYWQNVGQESLQLLEISNH